MKAEKLTGVVGVIGCGAMGMGIAQVAAAAGHRVKLFDARAGAADKARESIGGVFKMLVEKRRMSEADYLSAQARLEVTSCLDQFADAILVVEAIIEDLDAKRSLLMELETVVGRDCILASNTSSLSITAIGAKLAAPWRMVGMHFFNPVPVMALVEVVSGAATDRRVAELVYATAAAWGKSPVHAKSTPGFIVNRIARPYYSEALRLLNEQASDPATIDAIMREAGGFRMGPLELMDFIGHDVNYAVTRGVFEGLYYDPRFSPSLVQQELVLAGFLGRKSGRGFFHYGVDAMPPQPHTEAPLPLPECMTVFADIPLAQALAQRLCSTNLIIAPADTVAVDNALFTAGAACIYRSDGRSATQRAHDNGIPNTVLIDLVFDVNKATRLAVTCADQCAPEAFGSAVALLQSAGFAVSRIDDVPGMVVMRTVAMLANEAADTVNQGVCTAEAADLAMQKGANYPCGPLAWAEAIGLDQVVGVLVNLGRAYGEDRYRISPLLLRKVAGAGAFI